MFDPNQPLRVGQYDGRHGDDHLRKKVEAREAERFSYRIREHRENTAVRSAKRRRPAWGIGDSLSLSAEMIAAQESFALAAGTLAGTGSPLEAQRHR